MPFGALGLAGNLLDRAFMRIGFESKPSIGFVLPLILGITRTVIWVLIHCHRSLNWAPFWRPKGSIEVLKIRPVYWLLSLGSFSESIGLFVALNRLWSWMYLFNTSTKVKIASVLGCNNIILAVPENVGAASFCRLLRTRFYLALVFWCVFFNSYFGTSPRSRDLAVRVIACWRRWPGFNTSLFQLYFSLCV